MLTLTFYKIHLIDKPQPPTEVIVFEEEMPFQSSLGTVAI